MKSIFASLIVLLIAIPLAAHHSFMGEFDLTKPVVLKGVVTKVEWENPHITFFLNVKDENGIVSKWAVESASPSSLVRRGWTRDSLKPGELITIEGFLARNGLPFAAAKAVTLADGQRLRADSDGVQP